jgi:hypothetical protein
MLLDRYCDWSTRDPSAQVYVLFRDITLQAEEMGTPVTSTPATHPDVASFSSDRPVLWESSTSSHAMARSFVRISGECVSLLPFPLQGLQRNNTPGYPLRKGTSADT